MKWLVLIDDNGVQGQIKAGTDVAAAAAEEKSLEKRAKIMWAFERNDPSEKFSEYFKIKRNELSKKYNAATPDEFFGFNMRKRFANFNGLEVLADLDANDYPDFHKKYQGLKGAIEILSNSEKVMSGGGKDPAKAVHKMIRRLELEDED
jgi:hypothetical protein